MKFHYPIGLGVHNTELNAQTKHCSPSMKSRSRSETVYGSGQGLMGDCV